MSAADRMAVRMPGGKIRSVPRRVGLAMVARSQATHAPAQSAPRPDAKGRRPVVQTVVATDGPVTVTAEYDGNVVRIMDTLSQTPGQIAETMRTGSLPGGPAHSPVEDDDDPTALPVDAPAIERPRGNASREVWAEFAAVHGVDVTDEMGRNEVRDAVVAKLETDRMSRPAFPDHSVDGGRPATPEDEPVTEDMVTRDDPGERTT
jgi:hypothetical protein